MHSPSIYTHIPIYIYRKIAARCTTRLARSRSPITGAAHTVIPIQRQHAHKIAISVYDVHLTIYIYTVYILETGRCVSLQKAQWKRRHDYPDAEVARRDRASRASQATKNCRGSETAGARERRSTRDRDRRKRRLDSESATHDACIAENVSSYIISWGFTSCACLDYMLYTSCSMCMYIPSACFSGSVYSYIHLMSTTQLDRSRSPTMPCILLVYIYIYAYIYIYIEKSLPAVRLGPARQ